ncbi:IS3 family transposase [Streptomyces broussonetiae]|uniref:IS3 family transposase n=1 Tax=Streptomyces broussonetiae TaxID=2686304 RepID=UPI0035D8785B
MRSLGFVSVRLVPQGQGRGRPGRGPERPADQRRARGTAAAAQGEPRAAADYRYPKKSDRLLREGERPVSEPYRYIHTEKANYPITLLCRVLHVARSSYYAWREGEAARRRRRAADDALAHEITVLHLASRRTYGVPRIHAELRRRGRRVNRKRIARVMGERDIRGVTRRKHRSLTRPDKKAKPAPDLIGRDFHADTPGTKLVGDITYLPTAEGWLYLACWLDLATREAAGYAMADHHRAELVVTALDMAYGRGNLQPG